MAIHDEVAGLCGTAKGYIQFPSVLVHHAKWGVFLLTPPIGVIGLMVAACLTTTRVLPNVHHGLAIHAQSHDRPSSGCQVLFVDVGKDGIGLRNFFGV